MSRLWIESVSYLLELVASTAEFVSLLRDHVSLPFDFVSLLVKIQLGEFICLVCEFVRSTAELVNLQIR